jgi:hypothetical protein
MRAGALMGDNPWFDPRAGTVAPEPVTRRAREAAAEPEAAPRLIATAAVRRWWSAVTVHASPRP